jgi:ABC-type bacteriocin/lantibiotic exporter with double-glycine peptidase domain
MENKKQFDINKFVNEFNRFDSRKSIHNPYGNSAAKEVSEIAARMRHNNEIQRILSGTCL